MKRRDMLSRAVGCLALPAVSLPAWAQAKVPQAGVDFLRLDAQVAVEASAGQVEVLEFFWYNCPHCNAFEPRLTAWLARLPQHVSFRRVPVAFRADFEPQQRLYYALEAMGLVERLHGKIFAAIHGERQNLNTAPAIIDWVERQGVDRQKFTEQFNSFSATTKANRAKRLQNQYRVAGVPSMGVAGRFYTDGEQARTMERMLQVVDFLVAEVHAGR